MRRPRLGPEAPEAPAATSGDGAARRLSGARGAGLRAARRGGRCVRSVARSAAEARGPQCARRPPAPAAPPPVWVPARGPRGGACLSAAPPSPRAWRPLPGLPGLASQPRVDQDPRVAPFQYAPILSPAWPTLGPSQVPPPPILDGKSCFPKPGASQCQREEGKRSGEVVSGSQDPTRRMPYVPPRESGSLLVLPLCPHGACLQLTSAPRLCSTKRTM